LLFFFIIFFRKPISHFIFQILRIILRLIYETSVVLVSPLKKLSILVLFNFMTIIFNIENNSFIKQLGINSNL
jgi:hypothetical protein